MARPRAMIDTLLRTVAWRGRSVITCAAAGLLAGAVAGGLDAVLTGMRGSLHVAFVIVAVGSMALLGTFFGVALLVGAITLRRSWSRIAVRGPPIAWFVGSAWASVVLCLVVYRLGVAHFEAKTSTAGLQRFAWGCVPAMLAAWLCGAIVARTTRASRGRLVTATIALTLLVVVMLREALRIADDVDVRFVWDVAAFLVALPPSIVFLHARPRLARGALAVGLAAGGGSLVILAVDPSSRLIAARYSPAIGPVTRVLARLTDFDGDGFSPLSGEGDCAPFDAAIHPFAADVPGDGIDKDCHGGDLDPATLPVFEPPKLIPPEPRARPSVVLVTVDTLRADHLGLHGYERDTSPHIDAYFADALVFERAYTVSPVTDRTLPSMLGGLYPTAYVEALDYDTHVLDERRVLLPERLRDAGYRTVVLMSFHLFDDHGLDQGIDDLEILGNARLQDARRTTIMAVRKLREHVAEHPDRPLFLWVHYYEPHSRYTPPRRYRLWDEGGAFEDAAPMDLYDAEIRYVDEQIGRLLRVVDYTLDDPLVLITSDHGEEFLEHGSRAHARQLYDESVRVPLAIRGPGVVPRRVFEPVTLLDFTPTLLDLLEIPGIPDIEGRSQAPAVRGGDVDQRGFFLEQFKHGTDRVQKIAVVDGNFKLILDLQNQLWELYDLAEDPLERRNLYGRDLDTSVRLRALILDHLARAQGLRILSAGGSK